jgi:hypothetical protein
MFDGGNAADVARDSGVTGFRNNDGGDAELRQTIGEMREVMAGVLYYLQNPVAPEIAMYDTGGKKGLHSKMQEANKFMARYGG